MLFVERWIQKKYAVVGSTIKRVPLLLIIFKFFYIFVSPNKKNKKINKYSQKSNSGMMKFNCILLNAFILSRMPIFKMKFYLEANKL